VEGFLREQLYATRFRDKQEVIHYDSVEYSADSYASYIWKLQKPKLVEVITSHRAAAPCRLLDFACGTGRILSFVEGLVDQIDGVDISPEMAEVAQTKCAKAKIRVGDILTEPNLITGDYDFVTAFRYFLNAEEEMRFRVLTKLHEYLQKRKGLLITNIHGNASSVRYAALAYRRIVHGESHSQLSRSQVRRMFEETGFRIVAEYGFGVLPPLSYRTPLSGVAKWVDAGAGRIRMLTPLSIDLLYICQPV
jgi:SAM-dependent methyltransferase